MTEQITYYHDSIKMSPFCQRVEIALLEAGVSYSSCGFDIHNKPAWFAQVNSQTGKIPTITYGGPNVPAEEPSPLSFKLTESLVILEFLADLFPNSGLFPPATNPTARARVRFFIDVVERDVVASMVELSHKVPGAFEKLIGGLEKVQTLLPDPDETEGGEYATGKDFTNADCAIAPILAYIDLVAKTDLWTFEPGTGKKIEEALAGAKFDRLRRHKKALFEKESVKKVIDLERMESTWKVMFARN